MQLKIIQGNVLTPIGPTDRPKIIMHIVNDVGGWGKGFVKALGEKWPDTEATYREWYKTNDFALGKVMSVPVGDDTWVCHMVAQKGFRKPGDPRGKRYVSYKYLVECLLELFTFARHIGATVHAPKIGCGLGGGEWRVIEPMITSYSGEVPVTIYEL
jgi:O-acetyl-ADP-ribose deacetylase (regulator of RNase III)